MNNDEQWTFQLSVKLGQDRSALLNVRAKDIAEFAEALRSLTSNAPEIASAAALFDPPKTIIKTAPPSQATPPPAGIPGDDSWPQTAAPPPPAPATTGQTTAGHQLGTEIGPFVLRAEAKAFIAKTGKNAGKASTRYVASLPGGIVASTFDELYGSILLQLNGKNAYARVDKNTKGYYDLVSVRPAP